MVLTGRFVLLFDISFQGYTAGFSCRKILVGYTISLNHPNTHNYSLFIVTSQNNIYICPSRPIVIPTNKAVPGQRFQDFSSTFCLIFYKVNYH